jgi:hypothetical protein
MKSIDFFADDILFKIDRSWSDISTHNGLKIWVEKSQNKRKIRLD